jgi:squalene cyclase
MDEEQQVLSESRADVRPLHLDVVDTMGTQDAIQRFNELLTKPHVASGVSYWYPTSYTLPALLTQCLLSFGRTR